MTQYAIVGAGGFGREVLPLVRSQLADELHRGSAEIVFAVEGPVTQASINGTRVITLEEFCASTKEKYFNIAIADSATRQRIAEVCCAAGGRPFTIRAANAVILDEVEIGEGAIICPFVTITSNVKIGRLFHANIYSYIAHDCILGDYVTLAPRVSCNGRVTVEDHAYIGTGAVLREGSQSRPMIVGENAIVGMGAVVTRSVEKGVTVIGNPAKPLISSAR
jgi:sugar O-acyltransferase (sialic acid O-acetyltransferase NeuD family)